MNPILIVLLVGLLVLTALALGALVWAVRQAADGYEDETGFHLDSVNKTEKPRKRAVAPRKTRAQDRNMGPIEPVLN